MTNNLEQAAANLLNALNNPSPRPLAAATTCREAALDEPNVHFNHHEDRHVDAATVHALLEIAEQLRIANLLTLVKAPLSEHIPCEPDCTDVQAAAVEALVNIKTHVVPTGIPPAPDEYVTAHLRPGIAAALGIEFFDEQEQQ